MATKFNVSIDNPYGNVHIPRATLRPSDDGGTVIANPMAVSGDDGNPYSVSSSAPPPYVVKDAGEEQEEGKSRACCYRCRRRK